jgi:thioredoxin 1
MRTRLGDIDDADRRGPRAADAVRFSDAPVALDACTVAKRTRRRRPAGSLRLEAERGEALRHGRVVTTPPGRPPPGGRPPQKPWKHPRSRFGVQCGMTHDYATTQPARAEIDALAGATLLEFGTGWCGFCRAAHGPIAEAVQGRPQLRHLKAEDGPGRPLGRSFKVKLWPTLVFLRDGQEVARLVRPGDAAAIAEALERIGATRGDAPPAG